MEKISLKFGEKARQFAEFGIGSKPKAKIIDNVIEDEKVLEHSILLWKITLTLVELTMFHFM
jgi:leucyl aminopeptidase (aminopeptidase T)